MLVKIPWKSAFVIIYFYQTSNISKDAKYATNINYEVILTSCDIFHFLCDFFKSLYFVRFFGYIP